MKRDKFKTGDRVRGPEGTVRYERNGFVTVIWDDGNQSVVWATDLRKEAT